MSKKCCLRIALSGKISPQCFCLNHNTPRRACAFTIMQAKLYAPERQCALKRASIEKKYNDMQEESHTLLSIFFKLFFTKREYYGRIFDRIASASPFHRNRNRVCQRDEKIRNAARRQQLESPPRQIYLRAAEYRERVCGGGGEWGGWRKERETMSDSSKYFGHISGKTENKKADTAKNKSAVKKKSPRSNARAPLHTKIFFKVKILKPTRPHGRANIFQRVGIVCGAQILAVPNYGSARL